MHEYTVELRIQGTDLDPSLITERLALQPSTFRFVGEMVGQKRIAIATWGFNGFGDRDPPVWHSLEDGLAFVLGKLVDVMPAFEQYKGRFEIIWWCGHFQSGFDGGPTISAALLKRLSDFGVPLFIDNYFSSTSEVQPD